MGFFLRIGAEKVKNVNRFHVGLVIIPKRLLKLHHSVVKIQLVINLHIHNYNHSPQKYSNINTGLSTRSSALPLTNELIDHRGGVRIMSSLHLNEICLNHCSNRLLFLPIRKIKTIRNHFLCKFVQGRLCYWALSETGTGQNWWRFVQVLDKHYLISAFPPLNVQSSQHNPTPILHFK